MNENTDVYDNLEKEIGIEKLAPPDSVDYFIYRTSVERERNHATRWMVAFFIVFACFVITNVYWIWNEMQYIDEEITMTQEASTDGDGNAIINGTAKGDVNIYGESEADNNYQEKDTQNRR